MDSLRHAALERSCQPLRVAQYGSGHSSALSTAVSWGQAATRWWLRFWARTLMTIQECNFTRQCNGTVYTTYLYYLNNSTQSDQHPDPTKTFADYSVSCVDPWVRGCSVLCGSRAHRDAIKLWAKTPTLHKSAVCLCKAHCVQKARSKSILISRGPLQ